jgi:lipoyl(octanoyl) transferase
MSGVGLPRARLWRVEYADALHRQRELVGRRAAGEIPDSVWYLEHPPVVTWGAKGGAGHLRMEPRAILEQGVALLPTDRGGDVTYHGPGQLVGYPIVSLGADRDLHRYLRSLEEALIRVLGDQGLTGGRVPGRTGVWVGGDKIAAIGVRVSRWITSHGFALNVDCDLSGFGLIVPCGIADAGVTSLKRELERAGHACPSPEELVPMVHGRLEEALGKKLEMLVGLP